MTVLALPIVFFGIYFSVVSFNCEIHSVIHSVFHSFHGLMNSINWPALPVRVIIAQLVEHFCTDTEATGSKPVEAPKIVFFSGFFAIT